MPRPKKKFTLAALGEMLEFIVDKMATKSDLEGLATKEDCEKLDTRLAAVEGKVDGINRRLDVEAMARGDQKFPERVADLETEVFGQSRAPKHISSTGS